MADDKKFIKDDMNFLEYPNWSIDQRNNLTIWALNKPDGGTYTLTSPKGMPSYFDKKVLYYLMHKMYREQGLETYILKTTRYDIAKNISTDGTVPGKQLYKKIWDSLKKWKSIVIEFQGVFYEYEDYTIRLFNIIDEIKLDKKTGELTVRFSEPYINQQRLSTFYKLIDFEKYKQFNTSTAARLYELLIKSFTSRKTWAINIQLLAAKITLSKRNGVTIYYASDVLRLLRPALKEINNKTDLYIEFAYNKSTKVCVFTKKEKPKEYIPAKAVAKTQKSFAIKDLDACFEFFSNLPHDERSRIERAINQDPILSVLSDQKSKVFSYMRNKQLWPIAD